MKVLVPLADEQTAHSIVTWVCLQRWPAGFKFHLFHVTRDPLLVGSRSSADKSACALPFMEQAKGKLADVFGQTNVGLSFDFGDPSTAIFTELSRCDYQLVIVGRHSSSWASSCDPGTVCQRLLSHSPVPVLFLPTFTHAAPEQVHHCIISIKDSETATMMLPAVVQTLLGSLATDFSIATVADTSSSGEVSDRHISDEFLMRAATTVESRVRPSTIQVAVQHGCIVEAIASLCKNVNSDLIVIGKSMSRFYAHHADEIVRKSDYAVLLVTPLRSAAEIDDESLTSNSD